MLVFKIMGNVLRNAQKKPKTRMLGDSTSSTPTINPEDIQLSATGVAVGIAAEIADIATGYAVGKFLYKDQGDLSGTDRAAQSTLVQSGIGSFSGTIADNVVSSLFGLSGISAGDLVSVVLTENVVTSLTAIPCFYHGYKRHGDSALWGLGWSMFGNLGLAAAQNFAKPLPSELANRLNPAVMPVTDDEEIDEEIVVATRNPRRKMSGRRFGGISHKVSAHKKPSKKRTSAKKSMAKKSTTKRVSARKSSARKSSARK